MNIFLTTGLRCSLATVFMIASSAWLPALAETDIPLATPEEVSVEEIPVEEIPVEEIPAAEAPDEIIRRLDRSDEPITGTDETNIDTVNYADEKISVDYPAAWQLKRLDNGVLISSVATAPAELVATQIVRMAAPPGAVVNANIESFTAEGSSVARYSRATVDGQDALVMWLSNRPDELGSAIATFIGYDDETVLLFSRYAPENATAEADILQLHSSFTDPTAPAEAATEVAPTASSTDPAIESDSESASKLELESEVVPANGLLSE